MRKPTSPAIFVVLQVELPARFSRRRALHSRVTLVKSNVARRVGTDRRHAAHECELNHVQRVGHLSDHPAVAIRVARGKARRSGSIREVVEQNRECICDTAADLTIAVAVAAEKRADATGRRQAKFIGSAVGRFWARSNSDFHVHLPVVIVEKLERNVEPKPRIERLDFRSADDFRRALHIERSNHRRFESKRSAEQTKEQLHVHTEAVTTRAHVVECVVSVRTAGRFVLIEIEIDNPDDSLRELFSRKIGGLEEVNFNDEFVVGVLRQHTKNIVTHLAVAEHVAVVVFDETARRGPVRRLHSATLPVLRSSAIRLNRIRPANSVSPERGSIWCDKARYRNCGRERGQSTANGHLGKRESIAQCLFHGSSGLTSLRMSITTPEDFSIRGIRRTIPPFDCDRHATFTRRSLRMPLRPIALILICTAARPANANDVSFETEQITHGPKQHFFGYIGQSFTVPWDASGRYILALETAFHDRMPSATDAAKIVLIDTAEGNRLIELDRTYAWNFQQGTMFYWNPSPTTKGGQQFFFNDRDPKTGHVFTVLYDVAARKRLREYRFKTPTGNGGVAPVGGSYLAINYGRLARLRPVTGYPESLDWSREVDVPKDDGVFVVDTKTGKRRLLVSFHAIAERLKKHFPERAVPALFINHTLWNRQGDRAYFFARGGWSGQPGPRVNQPCSIHIDGTNLQLHETHIGGHPEWAEGSVIVGRRGDRQVRYDVDQKKIVGQIGTSKIFPDPEGDIAFSPDGRWFANGWSKKGVNRYVVYRLADGAHGRTLSFSRGEYSGRLRIDSAPRWNRTSDALLVSGLAADGTRQLFVVRVKTKPATSSSR